MCGFFLAKSNANSITEYIYKEKEQNTTKQKGELGQNPFKIK